MISINPDLFFLLHSYRLPFFFKNKLSQIYRQQKLFRDYFEQLPKKKRGMISFEKKWYTGLCKQFSMTPPVYCKGGKNKSMTTSFPITVGWDSMGNPISSLKVEGISWDNNNKKLQDCKKPWLIDKKKLYPLDLWFLGHFQTLGILRVADGVNLQKPITLSYPSLPKSTFFLPLIIIILGKGSQITWIEPLNIEAVCWSNWYIYLEEKATLYHIARPSGAGFIGSRGKIWLKSDTIYKHWHLASNIQHYGLAITSFLEGQSAFFSSTGNHYSRNSQSVFYDFQIFHKESYSKSQHRLHGVVVNKGDSFWKSHIDIKKNIKQVTANQFNMVINLGGGKAVSRPEFSIRSRDVLCHHGATVAPIDKAVLTYMRTRGLTTVSAQKLIIESFLMKGLEIGVGKKWLQKYGCI